MRNLLLLLIGLSTCCFAVVRTTARAAMDRSGTNDDSYSDVPQCDRGSSASAQQQHRYDPLVCWLWELQVCIPDESFRESFVTVSIENMKCTHFTMSSLQSNYVPSSLSNSSSNSTSTTSTTNNNSTEATAPAIDLHVSGVYATCQGTYHVHPGGIGGTVSALVQEKEQQKNRTSDDETNNDDNNNNYSVALSLDFESTTTNTTTTMDDDDGTIRMVSSINVTTCQCNLEVTSLDFEGSISAKLINLFRSEIQRYVTNTLSATLCPSALQPQLSQDLTNVVQQINKYILPLLPKPPQHNDDDDDNNKPMTATTTKDSNVSTTASSSVVANGRTNLASSFAAAQSLTTTTRNGNSNNDDDNNSNNDNVVDWKVDTPILYKTLEWLNTVFLNRFLHRGFFVDVLENMGWTVNKSIDCGYFFRGINGLLHTLTTDGHVVFDDIPKQIQQFTIVLPEQQQLLSITIRQVQLGGIDKLTTMNVLRPNQVLKNSNNNVDIFDSILSTNSSDFNMTVTMDVEIGPTNNSSSRSRGGRNRMVLGNDDDDDHNDSLKESFSISVVTSNASVSIGLGLDYDKSLFQNIHMQDIIMAIQNYNNVSQWSCLLKPIQYFRIVDLALNVHLSTMRFTPSNSTETLEKNIDDLLNSLLKLVLTEYQPLVTESLAGLVRGPAKATLNDLVNKWIEQQQSSLPQPSCRSTTPSDGLSPDFVDFNDLNILRQFNVFLNESLGTMNDYLSCVANAFNQSVQAVTFQFEKTHVNVTSLSIKDPGCIQQLDILLPSQDVFQLKNSLRLGQCDNANNEPEVFASANVSSPLFDFDGSFNVSVWLDDNVALTGGSMVKYDLNEFWRLSLSSMLSSDGLRCATIPIADLQLLPPTDSFESLGLNWSAILQSSVFNSTRVDFSTIDHKEVSTVAQSLLSWALTSMEELTNGIVDVAIEGRDDAPPKASHVSNRTFPVVAITAIVFLVINALFLCLGFRRRRTVTYTVLDQPLLRQHCRSETDRSDDATEDIHHRKTRKGILFLDKAVPIYARHLFPIVVVGTVVLLLASSFGEAVSIEIIISTASGKTVFLRPSLNALAGSVRRMITLSIYPLLFLVVGCSGIWPYVKLFLMLFGWCAPTKTLAFRQRGRLLFLLDSLGKFSLVGTFVLVVVMVSFRLHLVLEGMMTLDVFVNPGFGFFGFLLDVILSLIAGHFILFFHRRSQTTVQSTNGPKESLCEHEFEDGDYDSRRQMTRFLSGTIVALIVMALVFLSVGITRKSFVVEVGGVSGKIAGNDRRSAYSLLSLGLSLPQSVESPSTSMAFLQVVYFLSTVIAPFSCLVTLCLLFLVPLTIPWQKRVLSLAEVCNAWSAVEVFALSLLTSPSLFALASSIVDDKCDSINKFLAAYFDDALHGDDKCYTITMSVTANVLWLACGAVLTSVIASFLLRVARRALQERVERQEEEQIKDLLLYHHDDDGQDDYLASYDLVSMILRARNSSWLFFHTPASRLRGQDHHEHEDRNSQESADNSRQRRQRSQSDVDTRKETRQGSEEFWLEWREYYSVT